MLQTVLTGLAVQALDVPARSASTGSTAISRRGVFKSSLATGMETISRSSLDPFNLVAHVPYYLLVISSDPLWN